MKSNRFQIFRVFAAVSLFLALGFSVHSQSKEWGELRIGSQVLSMKAAGYYNYLTKVAEGESRFGQLQRAQTFLPQKTTILQLGKDYYQTQFCPHPPCAPPQLKDTLSIALNAGEVRQDVLVESLLDSLGFSYAGEQFTITEFRIEFWSEEKAEFAGSRWMTIPEAAFYISQVKSGTFLVIRYAKGTNARGQQAHLYPHLCFKLTSPLPEEKLATQPYLYPSIDRNRIRRLQNFLVVGQDTLELVAKEVYDTIWTEFEFVKDTFFIYQGELLQHHGDTLFSTIWGPRKSILMDGIPENSRTAMSYEYASGVNFALTSPASHDWEGYLRYRPHSESDSMPDSHMMSARGKIVPISPAGLIGVLKSMELLSEIDHYAPLTEISYSVYIPNQGETAESRLSALEGNDYEEVIFKLQPGDIFVVENIGVVGRENVSNTLELHLAWKIQ